MWMTTRHPRRVGSLARRALLATVAVLVAACGGTPSDPDGIVDRIVLDPTEATLTFAGQVVTILAIVYDTNGNTVGRVPQWTSSNPSVAIVDATGTVTAAQEGTTTMTASLDGVSATMTIIVDQQAASVTVTPASASVAVGGTRTYSALVLDGGDNPIPGAAVEWSSSDTGIATVSAAGVVTGVSAGNATITATSDGVSGNAAITVTAN